MAKVTLQPTGSFKPSRYLRKQFPMAMYGWGLQYIAAAAELCDKDELVGVRSFLIGHALELFLKSFLLMRGLTLTSLARKPYGHNLEHLLAEAERQGLDKLTAVSSSQRSELVAFNAFYMGKHFEYFSRVHILIGVQGISTRHVLSLQRQLQKPLGRLTRKYAASP